MGIRIYLDIKHRERFENHKATLTGFFVGKCSISPLSAHFSQYPAFGIVLYTPNECTNIFVHSLGGSETGTLLRLMSCKEPALLHVRKTFAHYIYTAKN